MVFLTRTDSNFNNPPFLACPSGKETQGIHAGKGEAGQKLEILGKERQAEEGQRRGK
jgi:hypothetical protein